MCLLWGGSSLTPTSASHYPVIGSDNICNSPRLLLIDIVCFSPLHIVVSLTVLKRLLGRGFHTLIRDASFSSSTDVGSHNPPLLGLASSLAHRSVSGSDPICNSPSPLLVDIVHFSPLRNAVARCLTLIPFVTAQAHH